MIKLNGVEIKPTIFPDKTSQVWKIPKEAFEEDVQSLSFGSFTTETTVKKAITSHWIEWDFENEAEFIHLAQLKTLLGSDTVTLDIPFLPYSRQDKKISNETTFARWTFLRLLESLSFNEITTLDNHSKIHPRFAKLIEDKFPEHEIDAAFNDTNPSLICFPDQGAKDRYGSFFGKFPSCSFKKDRDQETGYIKNLFLNELISLEGEDVLIIDDICDGGMTFKLTAEKLLQSGAKSVALYTTHGIYSKGIQTLKDSGISRIFNRKGEVLDD